jgi:hypothetical protein
MKKKGDNFWTVKKGNNSLCRLKEWRERRVKGWRGVE